MYVCVCRAVTDGQIRRAAAEGARTVGDLGREFGLGRECGLCVGAARECLTAARESSERPIDRLLALVAA